MDEFLKSICEQELSQYLQPYERRADIANILKKLNKIQWDIWSVNVHLFGR